ncbi:putative regulatory protein [Streptomyces davaonensis JCM 4913]|uniref:Putative regulatory protein n=1 Tax=Streptomyces davaonensis (strain DSM 101723 / JCM 4913 / KCC S-0913 / 768) TaxID=1214101 RepID=K4RB52_STRDJ|nr:TauD/TfdA family dioxygenase [Streptomyces davaonensis]CCK30420.1 putative regulatory protein [Streptomyces davaonensis JCM 4913]
MNDLTGITVIEADGEDLGSFTHRHAKTVDEELARTGAVLVRDAAADGADTFRRALDGLGFAPLDYTERSTPRSEVGDGVFTSTEYPAREAIPQHCESSYAGAWPGRVGFFCATPPLTGGATPIADVARVLSDIPAEVVRAVESRGLRYVRNYGSGVGLDWREAFQTDSREEVDRFCAAGGLEWTWVEDDGLRTVRRAPALVAHPRTGQQIWFNHLLLFHQSSLPGSLRTDLVALFGADGLPNDVLFGDGEPIPDDMVAAVRSAFGRRAQRFDWALNDLLVIDNMRWSHGREAFTGDRRILVSMSDLITRADLPEPVAPSA